MDICPESRSDRLDNRLDNRLDYRLDNRLDNRPAALTSLLSRSLNHRDKLDLLQEIINQLMNNKLLFTTETRLCAKPGATDRIMVHLSPVNTAVKKQNKSNGGFKG